MYYSVTTCKNLMGVCSQLATHERWMVGLYWGMQKPVAATAALAADSAVASQLLQKQ